MTGWPVIDCPTGGRASAAASPEQHLPGEVFLDVAADVLDWCGASRADPLALEGMRERFLPELRLPRPAEEEASVRDPGSGGVARWNRAGLAGEVAWWQTDDFWQYALYAAVAYIRAAAGRVGVPVRQVCQELTQRDGPPELPSLRTLTSASQATSPLPGRAAWQELSAPEV